MNAAERRTKITHLLAQANGPLSATALAAQCGVSRQIIVGDVALLRAVYGQICAPLHIFSRYDADAFNEKIQQSGSRPLSNLTGGIHLHTIRATDEKTLERVIQGLKDKGFLLLEDN